MHSMTYKQASHYVSHLDYCYTLFMLNDTSYFKVTVNIEVHDTCAHT